MTDQLNVVINPKVVVDGLSSLAQVRAAIAEINNTPVSQIKRAMLGLTGSLKSLSTELESVFSGLSSQVTKAMGDAEVKGKAGAKKLKKTLQTELDENAPVVNIRVSAKSVTLPGGLKAAISQAGVENLGALAEMRKSLTDMAGSADTSSAAYKNLTKNAQFAKKSLEEQLAVAKLVKEASKIDGVTAQQLVEQNGSKAVWASRNIAAVEAKVQAQTLAKEQLTQSDMLFKNTLARLKEENSVRQASAKEQLTQSDMLFKSTLARLKEENSVRQASSKEQLTQRAADLKAADRMELESFRAANAAKQAASAASSKEQLTQRAADLKAADRMELESFRAANAAKQAASAASSKEQLTQRAADLKAADRMELESFRAANAAKQAEAARTARIVANQSMSAGTPITPGSYSVIGGPNEGALRQVNKAMQDGVPAAKNLQAAKAALRSEMHELHSAARGLASGFGAMWLTWGSIVPLMAGAAVSSALVQTVKIGAEVQDSLTRMQVLTDESSTSIGNLNTKLLELARTGPIGPKEIAEAMKTMALAGQSAEEVSTSIKDVLNFALAGDVSIKTSADTLTTVGTAFKIGADGFGYMADVISKVAAESKSSVEDMAGAMKTASVINQQYGVSLEEVAVGNALLANAGIRGTAAGTALRNMYADLGGKTKKVADELKNLGVVAFDPLTGRMRDTGKVFKELMNALETQKTPEGARKSMETLFGERGSREAFALMGALGRKAKAMGTDVASAYDEMRKAAEESAGFTAISAAKIALTPLNQMKSVTATLQATLAETFDSLSPYMVETARHMKEIFSSDGFKTTLRDIVTTLGAITVFVTDHAKAIAAFVAGLGLLKSVAAFAGQVGSALTILGGTATATAGAVGTIGTAARLASAANPILMALTTLISAAAFAWGVYEIARGKSAKLNEGSALKGMEDLIKNLETEEAHIKDVNEARKKGIDLRDQERQRIVSAYQLEGVVEVERAREKMLESSAALSRFKSTNTGMGSYLSGNAIQDGQRLKGLEDQAKSDAQALERLQNTRSGNLARMAQLDASIKKEADYSARMIESDKVMEDWRNRKKYKGTDNGSKPEKSTATTEKLSAHEKISKAIQEELTLAKAQLDSNDKLSASEKYRIKTLSEINDQYLRGKTTVEEWAQEAKDAWEAADYKKQFEDAQAYAKMVEASTAAHLSAVNAQDKRNESLKDQIEKQRESNDAIGLSADAVGELEKRTLLLSAAELIRKANLEDGVMRNQDTIDGLREQARLMQELANQKQIGGVKKAANEAHKEWQKTADKINDSITDALMRGFENGKGFAENLRDTLINMFKTMVLRPVIAAIVSPVGQAFAGVGGQTGSGGSAIGVAQSLKGVYDTITGGFTALGAGVTSAVNTLAVSSAGAALGMSTAVEAMGPAIEGGLAPTVQVMTSSTAAAASAMGAAASIAAGVVAGYGIGTAVSGQFGSNNTVKAGTVIGAVAGSILGPVGTAIGAAIGGTIGGVINRAFGMGDAHSREHGIEGQFRSGAFSGNSFDVQHQDGGWFRGDRDWTDRAPVDDITTKRFSEGFAALQKASASAAQALGFSATAIEDYSQDVRVSLTTDAEENKKIITKLFTDMGDSMANAVAPGLATFAKDGESAATTLSRLSGTLTTVNAWLGMMNHALFSLSMVSGDAATKLADAFGGLDNFTNASKAFYDSFYSDQEKISESTEAMSKALALVGVALPSSKDAFKEVARAMDLSTDAGRQAYAVLLSVAPEFSATADLIDKVFGGAAKTIRDNLEKEAGIVTTWANKLAVLQGKTTDRQLALEADLATTNNEATKALIERVYALENEKTAAEALKTSLADMATAMRDAQAAMQSFVSATQSITLSKNTLAGKTALENGVTGAGFALDNAIQAIKDLGTRIGDKGAQDYTIAQIESVNLNDFAGQKFAGEFASLLAGYWDAKVGVQSATDALSKAAVDNTPTKVDTSAADAIANERKTLQDQYDQLTMSSIDLMLKQRAALDESNRALFDSINAIKMQSAAEANAAALKKANQGWQDQLDVLRGVRTQTQVTRANELAAATQDSTKALMQQVYAQQDLNAATEAATAATKAAAEAEAQRVKAIADQKDSLTTQWLQLIGNTVALREREIAAIDDSNKALQRQIWSYQDAQEALNAATGASDSALGGIQKALDAQVQTQTKARDAVKGLFDLLKTEVDKLYGQVSTTASMAAAEGQAYIETALALYKSGGVIPDQAKLGSAITAAQSGFGTENSQFEVDRNRLLLAGKLGQLQDIAGPQLTLAEQQLAVTNDAYTNAKAQLDTLRGINDSTLSVAAAVEAFQVAFTGEQTARQKLADLAKGSAASAGGGRAQADANADPANQAAGVRWAGSRIDNLIAYAAQGGNIDIPAIASEIKDLQQYIASGGVRSFAVGTDYVPRDMIAQIHKGEAIVPAAFNPARYQNNGNDALVAEIKALREEVKTLRENNDAGLQAVAINTLQSAKLSKRWDGDGLPATRTTT